MQHKDYNNLQVLNYEMEESLETLNVIIEILGKIIEAKNTSFAIGNIIENICQYINFPKGAFVIKDKNTFKISGHYGFTDNVVFQDVVESSDSFIWCANDIGSSLIIQDIEKDQRFKKDELFKLENNTSAIAHTVNLENSTFGILIFFSTSLDMLLLRKTLGKINRIITIITPHLNEKYTNELKRDATRIELENEKENAKGLLQIVGHDINNALNIISSSCLIGLDCCSKDSETKELWKSIHYSSDIIAEIIQTVGIMQSLDKDKLEIDLYKVSVKDAINKANFIFKNKLKEKNLKLVFKNQNEDIHVLADPNSFSNQVINNIVSNAIKFSQDSEIIVSATIENDQVHLQIRDFGIGMPEQIMNNIFNPKGKTSRKGTNGEKGTGFGMPLVKSYIHKYGGKIEVESKNIAENSKDHGSVFHIYLQRP